MALLTSGTFLNSKCVNSHRAQFLTFPTIILWFYTSPSVYIALFKASRYLKPVTRPAKPSIRVPKPAIKTRSLASSFRSQRTPIRSLYTSSRCRCDSLSHSNKQDIAHGGESTNKQPEPPLTPSTEGVFQLGNVNEQDSLGRMLTLVFTCSRCNTRAARQFSHHSYTQGVVIIQCPGCEKYHLIADHLGWFEEGKDVEEFLAKRGEKVRKITDPNEITPEIQAYVDEAVADRQASIKRREAFLAKRAEEEAKNKAESGHTHNHSGDHQ